MTDKPEDPRDEPEPDPAEVETVTLSEVVLAVDRLDPADPDWVDLQWHVADELHDQHVRGDDPGDLDEAIRRGQMVTAAQDEQSPAHLHDLALMLWDRFDETHRHEDLLEYTRLLQAALTLLDQNSVDAELEAKCQANLATGLVSRNRYDASEPDITWATTLWEAAMTSGQLDDDVQAGVAANLAQALARDGASEQDLRRAVDFGRRSVQTAVTAPEEMAHNLFALAAALASLHSIVDDDGLLKEAIEDVRQGLHHLGPDHPDGSGYTANLIGLLRQQARETEDAAPLNEAVQLSQEMVRRTTDDDMDRVLILTNAAAAISEAATQRNDPASLNEALTLYRRAIAIARDSSPEEGVALVNLASVCRDANEQLDAPHLLEEGIGAGDRALNTFKEPGQHRAHALTATSNCLRDRFILTSKITDLDRALSHAEEAAALTPEKHPEKAARLTNLAVVLSDDYTERANRGQLDRAITLYREALEASERVGVRVPERLNDLALALRDRHKDAGNPHDLHEAIHLAEGALTTSDPGRLMWAGYANNLGNALAERYELDSNPDDLNRVVDLFERALANAEGRSFELSGYANNLGLALATRARVTGVMTDVDQALLSLARSIDVLPPGHADCAYRTSNLADAYRQRSIMLETGGYFELARADAEAAVDTAEDAVHAAGPSEARLLPGLSNLAEALRWQRALTPGSVTDSRIVEVQRRAATLNQISPAEKFGQAGRWAQDAEYAGTPAQALVAYELAVAQTTEVAWIGLSAAERLGLLRQMNEVLSRAIACAVAAEQLWTAVAWADHVRSVLWRQGLQVAALGVSRNDERLAALSGLHELPAAEPVLQRRHREQRRQLVHSEREALQVQVPTVEQYESLTFPGIVALLVPNEEASCAVLLRAHQVPHVVALPLADRSEITTRVEELRGASAMFNDSDGATAANELLARHAVFDCLDWLWTAVAEPILNEIAPDLGDRPQLWWSPVGEFTLLPIHAAGLHPRKSGQLATPKSPAAATLPDRARSSYLPTIIGPRSPRAQASRAPGHLLYISANDTTEGLTHLAKEQQIVRSALRTIPVTNLVDENATIPSVREAIPNCSYLHIAAHGTTDAEESFNVGFELRDGLFTLRDLAGCNTQNGVLAVLLTCDSATGDAQTPNEALHVAGAAHQAGFPDVIAATMPLRDTSSIPVVDGVYRAVDTSPEAVSEAVLIALDEAVQGLRLNPATATDPLSWVPYAHFRAGLGREA